MAWINLLYESCMKVVLFFRKGTLDFIVIGKLWEDNGMRLTIKFCIMLKPVRLIRPKSMRPTHCKT